MTECHLSNPAICGPSPVTELVVTFGTVETRWLAESEVARRVHEVIAEVRKCAEGWPVAGSRLAGSALMRAAIILEGTFADMLGRCPAATSCLQPPP